MFEVLLNSSKLSQFVLKLVALASLSLTTHTAFAASDRVTVAWDPNPEPDISGYQVHYGVVNSGITNVISSGTNTEQDVSGLQLETDYWFYVTAKNTVGLESDPSTVLFHTTVPATVAPTITSAAPPNSATVGTGYGYSVAASGDPTITFDATGLPSGLSITSDGVISGILSATGTFNGAITASNGTQPDAVQPFTIVVYPVEAFPPTITSSAPRVAATVGSAYGHVVTATGDSTITFSATGLPPGLSITASGTISGTPSESGIFNGVITAANGTLPNASQFYSIFVYPEAVPPTITSVVPPAVATVGSVYDHTAIATGDPTITFDAFGLPPGLFMASNGVISGTPSAAGTFDGVIAASNGTQPDATQAFSIAVSSAAVAPTITSLLPPAAATVGSAYGHTVSATGDPTISFSATGLPTGLLMTSSGTISGTPSAAGTFDGVITASNGTQPDATQAFSIIVSPVAAVPPTITSDTPPAVASVGSAYSHIVAAMGDPTITFSAFGLPVGLAIASNGIISGTPSVAGTFNGVITASNGTQPDATQLFSIVVSPGTLVAPTITSAAPTAAATVGVAYSYTVTATGDPTITFGAFGLPAGLAIASNGTISGTPSVAGTFDGVITASNGTQPDATQLFSIVVSPGTLVAPTITSAAPAAAATAGVAYSYTVTATGDSTITFSAFGLPVGLAIASNGTISGTPSVAGTFDGVITASNGTQPDATQLFSIVVSPGTLVAPTITSAAPAAAATVGVAYSYTVTATGDSTITFSAFGLPVGLAIASNGIISGTPSVVGTFDGVITASNGTRPDATQLFSIVVSPGALVAPIITSAAPPATATVGVPYSYIVTATGDSTITFSAFGLPSGILISPQGLISGTPTTTGTYSGEIIASNGTETNATQPFTITITSAPALPIITSGPPPRAATVGVAYSHTVTANGTSPISFSAAGLPPGLSISPSGTLSGTPIEEGWYNGLIRATNPVDTSLQLITIIVSPPDTGDPPVVYFEGDRIVLIPATINPKANASDDKLSPEKLTTSWTQVSGPTVSITGGDKLRPSIEISEPGEYRFRVTVDDGGNTASDEFQLNAYEGTTEPPPGSVVPNIQFVGSTFDGMIVAWDSAPDKTYSIGFKDDLNDASWRIIEAAVPSLGYTTYWVDDQGYQTSSGFFGIFQIE